MTKDQVLKAIAGDDELLEVGRQAIEDALISMRDSRIFTMRRNGLVCREKDGTPSAIIRFGPETAIRIGLLAIAKHLKSKGSR